MSLGALVLASDQAVASSSVPGRRDATGASSTCNTGTGGSSTPPLPQGDEPVHLDPGHFVPTIDHPYWPLKPGSKWTSRETDGAGGVQKVVVTVTRETKEILGIPATVVHDVVRQQGRLVEDTWDWYAQDDAGNLWYLGEDTTEYANGKVKSTEGSWEAGVDGAQPGIILPADPEPGVTYRQEYSEGVAEDAARILSVDEKAQVPTGFYDCVVLTKDYTALEPRVVEYKLYARGVGPVLVVQVSGGGSREELTHYRPGR